jgi:hypothetical protein
MLGMIRSWNAIFNAVAPFGNVHIKYRKYPFIALLLVEDVPIGLFLMACQLP